VEWFYVAMVVYFYSGHWWIFTPALTGDAAKVFETPKHTLDDIPTFVSSFIEPMQARPVRLVWNDWLYAPCLQMVPPVIGVIGFIGQQIFCLRQAGA